MSRPSKVYIKSRKNSVKTQRAHFNRLTLKIIVIAPIDKKLKEKSSNDKSDLAKWVKFSKENNSLWTLALISIHWMTALKKKEEKWDPQTWLKMQSLTMKINLKNLIGKLIKLRFFTHLYSKQYLSWIMTLFFLHSGTKGKHVSEWMWGKISLERLIMDFQNFIKGHMNLWSQILNLLSHRSSHQGFEKFKTF